MSHNHECKGPWYLLRNEKGQKSVTITMMLVAFWATTLWYIASIFENVGSHKIRTFDTGACGAYLIPILTLYFGRKWTDIKNGIETPPVPPTPTTPVPPMAK